MDEQTIQEGKFYVAYALMCIVTNLAYLLSVSIFF